MSKFDCFESLNNIFSSFALNFFLTLSLISFASSLNSLLAFILGHFSNVIVWNVVNALSQLFIFAFKISKLLISCPITIWTFSRSSWSCNSFFKFFNISKSSVISSSISSNKICPHGVLEKSSSSLFSKLNISICSSSHFSGNGILLIALTIFKIKSFNGESSL